MKPENLLIILTRNPELGKCKTRLAKTIGDALALEVYLFLLHHTARITQQLQGVDKQVCFSEKLDSGEIWKEAYFSKAVQKGADLGERMSNAFKNGFTQGYKKVVVIGSDLYDLSAKDLKTAFEKLEDNDVVLGPALDGGYYLLGMKEVHPKVFVNKSWGTDTVLKDTLKDLNHKKIGLLPKKNDIDYYDDIKDHPAFEQLLKPFKS